MIVIIIIISTHVIMEAILSVPCSMGSSTSSVLLSLHTVHDCYYYYYFNSRDHGLHFVGAVQHGFEHILLVVLGPQPHGQLGHLQRVVVQDGDLAAHHVPVLRQVLNRPLEVLVRRQLENNKPIFILFFYFFYYLLPPDQATSVKIGNPLLPLHG